MSPGASKSSDNMLVNFMLGGVSGGISKVVIISLEVLSTQNLKNPYIWLTDPFTFYHAVLCITSL